MKVWQELHGPDGDKAWLLDVPWWALVTSWAIEALDVATGCVACGARAPGWLWGIPLGRPVREGEGDESYVANSVAGRLYDFVSWGIDLPRTCARHEHWLDLPATKEA